MKLLIATDSFKNSLSTFEVVDTIAKAALNTFDNIKISKVPLADGGENTLDVLDYYLKFQKIAIETVNEKEDAITTYYGLKDNIAYIESAKVIGLKEKPRNILNNSSYGVGILIKDALKRKVETIYLTLGGSSTNDAGIGLLSALGVKFYDKNKQILKPRINNILKITDINLDEVNLGNTKIIIMSDVNNPFIGDDGATHTYAKQKGASKKEILYLEECLTHLNQLYLKLYNIDLSILPHTGAAGGISGSLHAILNSEIKPGIDTVLELIDFKTKTTDADLIITGEGRLDYQSLYNKVVVGVAKYKVPTIVIAGSVEVDNETLNKHNIIAAFSSTNKIMDLDSALNNAEANLYQTALNIFHLIQLSRKI